VVEGARCATHHDALAAAACERCGDFACTACLASSSFCPRCRPLAGGQWEAGRKLSTLGIVGHALGIFPQFLLVTVALAVFAAVPVEVGRHLFMSWTTTGRATDEMAVAVALVGVAFVAMFFLQPIAIGGTIARTADILLVRPQPRGIYRAGSPLWGRMLSLQLLGGLCAGLVVVPQSLAVSMLGKPAEITRFVMDVWWVAAPVPIYFLGWLAMVAAAIDDVPTFRAIARAWHFVKSNVRGVFQLCALQMAVRVATWGLNAFFGSFVRREPGLGLPLAVGGGTFQAALLIAWPIVFAAFWLARSRPDEMTSTSP
jgi:hypothetical protein